jgi:putative phosphoribosyl transferase
MDRQFTDRREAGKLLASKLIAYQDCAEAIVLALPRGGVPVAFEIATRLHLPLDVWIVRKLGVPYHKELAMGAIAASGERVINRDVVRLSQISSETIERVVKEETEELQRRDQLYREGKPWPSLTDQIIILVDDGIATGATMQAAIASLKPHQPKEIIVAVPIVSADIGRSIQTEVDQVVCLLRPKSLDAIGRWYLNFAQTTDQEVRDCLAKSAKQLKSFSPIR